MLTKPIVIAILTHVNQTIMLYTLNLKCDACQLFLNTTGKNTYSLLLNDSIPKTSIIEIKT